MKRESERMKCGLDSFGLDFLHWLKVQVKTEVKVIIIYESFIINFCCCCCCCWPNCKLNGLCMLHGQILVLVFPLDLVTALRLHPLKCDRWPVCIVHTLLLTWRHFTRHLSFPWSLLIENTHTYTFAYILGIYHFSIAFEMTIVWNIWPGKFYSSGLQTMK